MLARGGRQAGHRSRGKASSPDAAETPAVILVRRPSDSQLCASLAVDLGFNPDGLVTCSVAARPECDRHKEVLRALLQPIRKSLLSSVGLVQTSAWRPSSARKSPGGKPWPDVFQVMPGYFETIARDCVRACCPPSDTRQRPWDGDQRICRAGTVFRGPRWSECSQEEHSWTVPASCMTSPRGRWTREPELPACVFLRASDRDLSRAMWS